jgi:hypothetical protein
MAAAFSLEPPNQDSASASKSDKPLGMFEREGGTRPTICPGFQ